MAPADPCPFGETRHTLARRHSHDYRPVAPAARQCSCGSRRWTITVGGILGAVVACQRCHQSNRVATAYERGREDGPREVTRAAAAPPF